MSKTNQDTIESNITKAFFYSTIRVMLIIFLCKIVSTLKEIAIAYRYGTSELVDAYQFSVTMATFLPNAIASAIALASTPVLTSTQYTHETNNQHFIQMLETRLFFAGAFISCILFFSFPNLLQNAVNTQSKESIEYFSKYANGYFKSFCILAPFIILSGLCVARLRSRQKQIDSLIEIILPTTILTWLLLGWSENTDTTPLLYGTLIGFILQFIFLRIKSTQTDGISPKMRLAARKNRYQNGLYKKLAGAFLYQILIIMIQPLDQYMAAGLQSNSNSILGYSDKILYMLLSIGGVAIARTALPFFSKLRMEKNKEGLYKLAIKYSIYSFLAGVIIACITYSTAPLLVKLIFEYGEFSSKSSLAVSNVLRYGTAQIPFFFSSLLLIQLLSSEGRYLLISCITAFALAIKLILNYLLLKEMQSNGFMLATAAMYFIIFLSLFFYTCNAIRKNY